MSNPEIVEVPVYTVKSDWITYQVPLDVEPYDRVVGIETDTENDVLWTVDRVPGDYSSVFEKNDTNREKLKLPDYMAVNLLEFFKFHLTNTGNFRDLEFNCHRFAFNMHGAEPSCSKFGVSNAREIIQQGEPIATPLELGRHAVYGALSTAGITPNGLANPLHSVIGLGLEEERSLQVTDVSGHLGLRKYSNIDEYYRKNNMQNMLGALQGLDFYSLLSGIKN